MPIDPIAQRWYADSYIEGAIKQSQITSADKYYTWLNEQDLGVSRAVTREAWREYGIATKWTDVLSVYPEGHTIPRAWYGESNAKGASNYSYKIAATVIDSETGLPDTHTWWVRSDKALNRRQVEGQVTNDVENYYQGIWSGVTGIGFKTIYHKTGATW